MGPEAPNSKPVAFAGINATPEDTVNQQQHLSALTGLHKIIGRTEYLGGRLAD